MTSSRHAKLRHIRALVVLAFVCLSTAGFFYPRTAIDTYGSEAKEALPEPTPPRRRAAARAPARRRYTQFDHSVKAHQKACNSCHNFPSPNWQKVRAADAAFPDITDYPRHESCLSCHRQQFFRGTPPAICSICHTNPGPRNSNRHPFPNPREIFDKSAKGRTHTSDFGISFPHDKHIDIVSQNNERGEPRFVSASFERKMRAEESCAVCHKTYEPQGESADEFFVKPPPKIGDAFWLKKGTFKTVPIGHTTCFTCHSADSGMSPAPTDCATCHKLKQPLPKTDFDPSSPAVKAVSDKIVLLAWRNRDSSATFRHEFMSHSEMECATCHNVQKMNTMDPATKRVPLDSCAMCHVTSTVDEGGALNFEADARQKNPAFQCVKCHLAYGKQPIPESHQKALSGQ